MTSLSLWLIKIMETPLRLSERMSSNTRAISFSPREVVGSSIIMVRALNSRERAISTICLLPASSEPTRASGEISDPMPASTFCASSRILRRFRNAPRLTSSPINRFSYTLRSFIRLSS